MSSKSYVPFLRFLEFKENWKKVILKDVSTYSNGGSYENSVKKEGDFELITLKSIDMSGNLVNSKRYIDGEVTTLTKGTLVMILSEQSPGLLGMTAIIPIDNKFVLNQRVAEIRPNQKVESYFLSMLINKNQRYFSKHGAGTKVQNISKPNVEKFEFLLPSLNEQQKIASFLISVDHKINLLTKKKELMEQYKKGVMQKIFSQEIRFKDDNGNDFPDWKLKKVEEENTILNEKRVSVGQSDYLEIGDINPDLHTYKLTNKKTVQGAKRVPKNTLLISTVRPKLNKIVITKEDLNVSNAFASIQLTNSFLFYVFTSKKINNILVRFSEGGTYPTISKKIIYSMKILFPSIEEQIKISTFLSALSKKIDLVNSQIDKIKKFKKGLLQQMFV